MPDIEDDISADIAAAFVTLEAPEAQAAPAAAPEQEAPPVLADDRPRDEQGRFAPKAEPAAAEQPVAKPQEPAQATATPASGEPVAEVSKTFIPPVVWSAEQKSKFSELPTWAQEAIARREEHGEQGVAKLKQQLDAFQPIEGLLSPHRERWQMAGMSDAQALQSLLAAQSYLERDAPGAIAYLARTYGVDFGQLAAQPQGTPPGHQARQAPEYQALQRQLHDLQATVTNQQRTAEEQQRSQVVNQISDFAADPKHLYFHEVREDMAALMEAGRAPDLPTAYEMATWARPEIRKLIMAEEGRAQQAQEQERQRAAAAAARQAGGSITGDSLGGHKPAVPNNPTASIEDDVRAAFERLSGVV